MFETFYSFKGKQGDLLERLPGTIEGQAFTLENLTSCEVRLLDHSDQVQVDDLKECQVFVGPSSESVFLRDCEDCVFTIACKQLRTRDCKRCIIFLYSKTDPVIETSSDMTFAPFNGAYPGLGKHFKSASLDPSTNKWANIFDFNKDDDTADDPHYTLLPKDSWEEWAVPINDDQACENPVPVDLSMLPASEATAAEMQSFEIPGLPTTELGADGSVTQSFSIHTSMNDAQKMIDASAEALVANETVAVTDSAPARASNSPEEIVRSNPVMRGKKIRSNQVICHGGLVYLSGLVGAYQTTADLSLIHI
eukprot:TRINITY_DN6605_c0_g2_i2.p1 TRINITY_DN6605_c0_g2~~TRINITY_DN6605_c0_g2_i2.p1  ORF type:complete len:308 (-),score=41.05 TRINITY_DN6605_c0_g2_i2:41-964(-)